MDGRERTCPTESSFRAEQLLNAIRYAFVNGCRQMRAFLGISRRAGSPDFYA
jgi:hypothetical protein